MTQESVISPEKRLYWRFYRAVCRKQAGTMAEIIRGHPELHRYPGQAGPLLEIVDRRAPELLEAALEAGLSPDSGSDVVQTMLQQAVVEGDLERVRLLIRYGADLERRNDAGEVALGYACSWGQLEAARLLVEAGADVNAVEVNPETGHRCTPLDCTGQHPELAAYLRAHGARHLEELEGESI